MPTTYNIGQMNDETIECLMMVLFYSVKRRTSCIDLVSEASNKNNHQERRDER